MEELMRKIKNRRRANRLPQDAQVMTAILRNAGCESYDERVINLLLEFSHRYITSILNDAKTLADHAERNDVTYNDVKLAISFAQDKLMEPLPRRDLLELAAQKNSKPLPLKISDSKFKLPFESLLAPNFIKRRRFVRRVD